MLVVVCDFGYAWYVVNKHRDFTRKYQLLDHVGNSLLYILAYKLKIFRQIFARKSGVWLIQGVVTNFFCQSTNYALCNAKLWSSCIKCEYHTIKWLFVLINMCRFELNLSNKTIVTTRLKSFPTKHTVLCHVLFIIATNKEKITIITAITHIKNWSIAWSTAGWKQQIVITLTVGQRISLKEILSSKHFFTMNAYEVLRMPHASKSHYHLYQTTNKLKMPI